MAHVGEEGAFCAVCRLGQLDGLSELRSALGDGRLEVQVHVREF